MQVKYKKGTTYGPWCRSNDLIKVQLYCNCTDRHCRLKLWNDRLLSVCKTLRDTCQHLLKLKEACGTQKDQFWQFLNCTRKKDLTVSLKLELKPEAPCYPRKDAFKRHRRARHLTSWYLRTLHAQLSDVHTVYFLLNKKE